MKVEKTLTKDKQWKMLKQLRKRLITDFLDLIILARLGSVPYITGYDIIKYIHQKFKILPSSGTVYSTLYSMERNGLVRGVWERRRRIYDITPQGEELIKTVNDNIDTVKSYIDFFI